MELAKAANFVGSEISVEPIIKLGLGINKRRMRMWCFIATSPPAVHCFGLVVSTCFNLKKTQALAASLAKKVKGIGC